MTLGRFMTAVVNSGADDPRAGLIANPLFVADGEFERRNGHHAIVARGPGVGPRRRENGAEEELPGIQAGAGRQILGPLVTIGAR